MFDDFEHATDQHNDDEAFGILQDLEQSTPDEIRRQRAHFRIAIKTRLILQAGNASQLLDFKVQGVTGDISESGLGALFPIPLRVGDIYRLTFDEARLPLPLTFARCVRCRLVQEGSYEAGFLFFSPITLPEHLIAAGG
jgi:hypothetical protein